MVGDSAKNIDALITAITSNQNLMKCLYYTQNDEDILSLPNLNARQKAEVMKNNIYKYRKLPVASDKTQKTYLAIEYGQRNYGSQGQKYNKSNIWYQSVEMRILVMSTGSQDVNEYIGSRIDRIEEEIVDLFHKSSVLPSFSYSYVNGSSPISLTEEYIGRAISIVFVVSQNEMLR